MCQPTYEKVNEELCLDNPLHVILNKSKVAYRIYVILIANKELKKCFPLSRLIRNICVSFSCQIHEMYPANLILFDFVT
jgi:hypothetical protein